MQYLNAIAVTAYVIVAAASLAAAWLALRLSDRSAAGWWVATAAAFAGFATMRLLSLEEPIRDALRTALRGEGLYDERRAWQVGLVALAAATVPVVSFFMVRAWKRTAGQGRERAVLLGQLALLGFTGLFFLRFVSLHATDTLLYGWKLNWALDGGLTLLAGAAAALYLRGISLR